MRDLLLTREARRMYEQADSGLLGKLNRCFEQLRRDLYDHPNIKRLKGPLAGCYRYRLGDWRVVYRVDGEGSTVTVLMIAHRREVYRER